MNGRHQHYIGPPASSSNSASQGLNEMYPTGMHGGGYPSYPPPAGPYYVASRPLGQVTAYDTSSHPQAWPPPPPPPGPEQGFTVLSASLGYTSRSRLDNASARRHGHRNHGTATSGRQQRSGNHPRRRRRGESSRSRSRSLSPSPYPRRTPSPRITTYHVNRDGELTERQPAELTQSNFDQHCVLSNRYYDAEQRAQEARDEEADRRLREEEWQQLREQQRQQEQVARDEQATRNARDNYHGNGYYRY